MPIQDFKLYTLNGYAGDIVDSGPRVVQTGILVGADAGFGKALSRNAGAERGINLGSAPTVFAISQRELNHEAGSRPSTGNDTVYKATESVSIMRDGYIYIELVGGPVVAAGNLLFVNAATGTFSGDATDVGGVHVESTNVIADEAGIVGEIIKARIILA
tara:strand:+ start:80 stop:559 length:480 start_codon:yes stop_codon:yes gene_type:complete